MRFLNLQYKKTEVLILFFFLLFLAGTFIFNSLWVREQQFSYLARSFLQGQLHFVEMPVTVQDLVLYDGKFYWHMGPFPAILLMPFTFIFGLVSHGLFLQGYLQFYLTAGIAILCYRLAKMAGYSKEDSLYLSFAFAFASVYHVVAFMSWSWYFVQAVTVCLGFLAIYEWKTKKRYLLIGFLFALIFMSRFTAGLGVLFFVLVLILSNKHSVKSKIISLSKIGLPIFFAGVFLLHYNYARFQDPFNAGYSDSNAFQLSDQDRFEQINYGLFQLRNIPTNLYYYFVKMPDPVLLNQESAFGNTYILIPPYLKAGFPGVSFFVVAPVFLFIFTYKFKDMESKLYLATILIILLFLLTYYWVGWRQVGPRYTLDFLPFAYMLLLKAFKGKLTWGAKTLILSSAVFNLILFGTVSF